MKTFSSKIQFNDSNINSGNSMKKKLAIISANEDQMPLVIKAIEMGRIKVRRISNKMGMMKNKITNYIK